MLRWIVLLGTHGAMLGAGFALGIYVLPILTEPKAPDNAILASMAKTALYKAEISRDLRGNDFLHWGEGTVSVSPDTVAHEGRLAPGPDYNLYLVETFVEHEEDFLPIKDKAQLIGAVKTFSGFILDVPAEVDIGAYTTVLIWCETFGEFVAAAKYR